MTATNPHTLLFVDDEVSITKALKRLFRRQGYNILTASSGAEGLEVLKDREEPVALIISDQRMPEMNGAQFLEKAKAHCPDAIRLLLTGYSDMDAIVDAVNKGEIHRYLTKPWNDEDLQLVVRTALEQYDLINENRRLMEVTHSQNIQLAELSKGLDSKVKERTRELDRQKQELEKSLYNTVRLLSNLVGNTKPVLGAYLQSVSEKAKAVAEQLQINGRELLDIEYAGLIHDIGILGLPDDLWLKDDAHISDDEFKVYSPHPLIGHMSLQTMPQLGEVGELILNHHEHFDGSGFPNALSGEDIPLGARILCAVTDYCRITDTFPKEPKKLMRLAKKYLGKEADNVMVGDPETMRADILRRIFISRSGSKYDPKIVRLLLKDLRASTGVILEDEDEGVASIHFNRLKAGMRLASTLRTCDGRNVLSSGSVLNTNMLRGIVRLGEAGNIKEDIYVFRPLQ